MALRIAAALSLVLSTFALLVAGMRTLANVVFLAHPETLTSPAGVEAFQAPTEVRLLLASAATTLGWLAVVSLTAALLGLSDTAQAIAGRALVAAAGLLLLLPTMSVLHGGLTEAAAASVAMVAGAWAARSKCGLRPNERAL